MEQTRSLGVGCQVPFLLNGSRLTAFIHASLSCLHLMGPGKICKWSGGLHSKQSPFFWQLPWASRLCSVQVSFFHLLILWGSNTTIYFWHDERYVLKTTIIWKLRLAFEVCRPQTCNFIKKETLAQVLSCEFCEISKNTFSYRTPLVAASEESIYLKYPQVWLWEMSCNHRLCRGVYRKTKIIILSGCYMVRLQAP